MDILHALAVRICRRLFTGFPHLRSQSVRNALKRTGRGSIRQEERYYVEKVKKVLAVLIAGCMIVVFAKIASKRDGMLTEADAVQRKGYGGGIQTLSLRADTPEGQEIGTFEIAVEARQYTEEEAYGLFLQACEMLPEAILGENEDLSRVNRPLRLVTSLPGFPFRITWTSSRYFLVRTDGTVDISELTGEGEDVILTASFLCGAHTFEKEIALRVTRPVQSAEEAFRTSVEQAVHQAAKETPHDQMLVLPAEVVGRQIV